MSTLDNERDLDLLEEEVNRSRRTDKIQKWSLFVLAMLLLGASIVIWIMLTEQTNRADASGKQVVSEQAEKKDLAKEAQQALCGTKDTEIFDRALCEKLSAVAQEPPPPAGEDPGPSREDLVAAFRAYCAEGSNCKGRDGASPTADDIAKAFATFCADGRCSGKDGKDGADGADAEPLAPEYEMVLAAVTEVCSTGVCTGPKGADGADGANATPEMVLTAVRTFCAENSGCRGEKGDKGDKGADGADGQNVSLVSWTDPRTGDKYTCTPEPPGSTTLTCSIEPGLPAPAQPNKTLGVLP